MKSDLEGRLKGLLVNAQAGDQKSYTVFLREVYQYVKPIGLRRLGIESSTEDFTQEVLMAIHTKRHTYNPDKPLGPWINAITRYKLIDQFRKKTKDLKRELLGENVGALPSESSRQESDISDDMLTAIDKLPANYKEVIILNKVENLTLKEVAQKLNISYSSAKVRASRAYDMIRKNLEKINESID